MTSPENGEVRIRLEAMKKKAGVLSAAAEELTERLRHAEEYLRELKLGVEGWADIGDNNGPDDYGREWFVGLSFKRRNDGWRLVIDEGEPGEPDTFRTRELASASIAERIAAAKALPTLISSMEGRLDETLAEIQAACSTVDALTLGAKPKVKS